MQLYRALAAALGWFAIALQYFILARRTDADQLAVTTLNFFSYFTILSNILVALALTTPWLTPHSILGRFFALVSVRAGIAMYMIITASIYFGLLRELWSPEGSQYLADALLHYVMPFLYGLDWLLFVRKGGLRWKDAIAWLTFPLAFAAYSLIRGAFSGFYPYPFIDAAALGYARVWLNIGALIVAFVGMGLTLIAVGRWIASLRGNRPA